MDAGVNDNSNRCPLHWALKGGTSCSTMKDSGGIGSNSAAELELHFPAFPFMNGLSVRGHKRPSAWELEVEAQRPRLFRTLRLVLVMRCHCCWHWQDLLAHRTGAACNQVYGASSSCWVLLQLLWSCAFKEDASISCRTPSWVKLEVGTQWGPDAVPASQGHFILTSATPTHTHMLCASSLPSHLPCRFPVPGSDTEVMASCYLFNQLPQEDEVKSL